jgi:hypothetical protein
MRHMPEAVHALERELREVFAARLKSLVIYGPVASDDGRGHADGPRGAPSIHSLAVVDALGPADLQACAARAAGWHDAGLATPLILAAREFERSLDVFPFEFGVIMADHVVVAGASPFEGLRIEPADLRRACEVQARSHLLHLREAYIETRGRDDALALLIAQSAAPFSALVQSVARLIGEGPADPATAARRVERRAGLQPGAASGIVELAGAGELPSADAQRLFPPYLDAVERLVEYVDRWVEH